MWLEHGEVKSGGLNGKYGIGGGRRGGGVSNFRVAGEVYGGGEGGSGM